MNIYTHLNEKKFRILSIISCLAADIFVALHVYTKFVNREQFNKSLQVAIGIVKQTSPRAANLPPAAIEELWQMMSSTVTTVLVIYLSVHVLVYLLHYAQKKFVLGYIKAYAWSGGVLMGLYGLFGITQVESAKFLIPSALLLVIAFGFKHFKKTEE